ncbi:MAG: gliding motility-associated C-terminal domain-containing protein [Saprospiraceae bacterium]|nr:gliding motility-associated C-terminal domain-containing protein [Saprospiraceae bacterium]
MPKHNLTYPIGVVLFLYSFLGFISPQQLYAQSIDDLCIRHFAPLQVDSLTWSVNNICPNFDAYIIIGTNDLSTGTIPLDTITDPNQTSYAFPNSNGSTWYYGIGLLCGGAFVSTSGLVSSQRPITPDIRSVSIVNGLPVLSWYASPSPDVIGYQIYKENPYGSGDYFPYPSAGSLASGTSFTDINATDLNVRYAITAVTPCDESYLGLGTVLDGTTGPHSSILIDGNLDPCTQSYQLEWNAYENWGSGVREYQLWASFNGGVLQQVASIDGNLTSYTYTGLEDDQTVVFELRAYENDHNNLARTNQVTVVSAVNRPMDFLYLTNLTVTSNASIQVDWEWDTDVDFNYAEILTSPDNSSYNSLQTLNAITGAFESYEDLINLPSDAPYYYKVRSYDVCNQAVTSNLAKTIHLTGATADNFQNVLEWSAFDMQYAELEEYQLYEIVGGNTKLVGTFTIDQRSYIDLVDANRPSEAETCYYIIAKGKLMLPNGQIRSIQNRSNTICLQQAAVMYMPNAIAPTGKNQKFRPVFVFGQSISNYSIQIFDRYGGTVFETADYREAWDGTNNGQKVPQGVYVYLVRFTQASGEVIEERGTVTVIY